MAQRYRHYTDEEIEYLRQIAPGKPIEEVADTFNKHFGTNRTVRSIASRMTRAGIKTGMRGKLSTSTQFTKGFEPWNKGMKGLRTPGSEKGWYKKGHTESRSPVGSERVLEGWTEIKIADPNVWVKKHRYVWEQAYGEIPERHVVLFKDGNRQNCRLDNLYMVNQNAVTTAGKRKQTTDYPELNEAIYRMTDLEVTANIKLRELE